MFYRDFNRGHPRNPTRIPSLRRELSLYLIEESESRHFFFNRVGIQTIRLTQRHNPDTICSIRDTPSSQDYGGSGPWLAQPSMHVN